MIASEMEILPTLITVISLAVFNEAKRYCTEDTHCEDLGKLVCVKTACRWGTCGCPPGRSPKYVGSPGKFHCAPNKKIGEYCSTENGNGVCLAPNSFCDMEDTHKCKCKDGFVPAWGGEACLDKNDGSEICNPPMTSSLSTCNEISAVNCYGSNNNLLQHTVLPMGPSTCPCPNTHTLDWLMVHGSTSYWKAPTCRKNRIGDVCLTDADCPNSGKRTTSGTYINGGNCDTNNRCVCENGLVPNYEGDQCKEGLSYGETCDSATWAGLKICNGEKGLVCGDICDARQPSPPLTGSDILKCTCGPYHTTSGTICAPIVEGSECHGDYNCRGMGPVGVCVDGICQNGGGRLLATWFLSAILPLLMYAAQHE